MVTSPTFADADDYIWTNLTIKDGEDYPTGYSNSNQSLNTVTTGANCKQLCADDSNCIAFWFSNGTRHATDSHGNIHDKPYPLCLHYSRLSNPIQWESYFDNVDYTERVFEKKGALKACVDPNSFNIGGNPNTSTLEMGKAYTGIGYLLGYLNSPQDCATEIQSSGGKAWVLLYFKGLNNLITGYCFGSSTGQDSGTQFTLKNHPPQRYSQQQQVYVRLMKTNAHKPARILLLIKNVVLAENYISVRNLNSF